MATNVYVDGFNLYYGALKRSPAPVKWVDLKQLAEAVWPNLAPVQRVRYFTARIQPNTTDPNAPARQQAYLRALRASGVHIHLGQFKIRRKTWTLAGAVSKLPISTDRLVLSAVAEVGKYDEKGSDVNLASYLIRDAAKSDFTDAIVISNDSDLAEAIRLVRNDFGLRVYVINPQRRTVRELRTAATDLRQLLNSTVQRSQLPLTLSDAAGTITKPSSW